MVEINNREECIKEYAKSLNMIPMSVIEDIKAEIEDFEEEVFHRPNTDYEAYASVRHCLEIIDKHISRKENE